MVSLTRFGLRACTLVILLSPGAKLWASGSAEVTPGRTVPVGCGNGILEAGETCGSCPVDCAVRSCTATTPRRTVTVNFTAPPDQEVNTVTVLVAYRSGRTSLPGSGNASSVTNRIGDRLSNAMVSVNDLDYALRVLISRAQAIPSARLFTVAFDSCDGAGAPTGADFSCAVVECVNGFGAVDGCECAVSVQ